MGTEHRQPVRVVVLSASLRRSSLNERLAGLAEQVIQQKGATAERAAMGDFDCVSFDFDVEQETGVPEPAARFRRWLEAADAFVIASPEYNASVPGALKNALDWASRPLATNVFRNKPVVVIGSSSGVFGAVWAQAELRKVLGAMGARVVEAEVAVGRAHEKLDADGNLADDDVRDQLLDALATLRSEAAPQLAAA